MENVKIININRDKEKTDSDTKAKKGQKKGPYNPSTDYVPPKRRHFIIPIIVAAIIVLLFVVNMISSYKDCNIENRWERNDTAESQYVEFNNNLVKYSSDGIFCTNYSGALIWNYTYNITKPCIDVCDEYIVVYDKKGNNMYLFTTTGYINTIKTSSPIVEAKIANKGTVAAMLQEEGITYLQLFNQKGTTLVSGEIHPENMGYPISMALSSTGRRMAISVIDTSSGSIGTKIVFYDFSDEGKKNKDNIVAQYKYEGILIPQIEFLKGDKAVAFGENEIIIYNDNTEVTVAKEIFLTDKIKHIFYNESYFGYVSETANEEGELINKINVYNLLGYMSLDKTLDETYQSISLLSNNEILLNNEGVVSIYNMQGFKKFTYNFDENVYLIIPSKKFHRYYLIEEHATEEIQIK